MSNNCQIQPLWMIAKVRSEVRRNRIGEKVDEVTWTFRYDMERKIGDDFTASGGDS